MRSEIRYAICGLVAVHAMWSATAFLAPALLNKNTASVRRNSPSRLNPNPSRLVILKVVAAEILPL
jgi:hypothetical protein